MIPGTVHRSPGICLTAVKNSAKPQPGDRLMKELCGQSSSQMGSFTSKWHQEVKGKDVEIVERRKGSAM